MDTLFFLIVFCTVPAGVLWLCRKIPVLGKLGPIMILYVVGMAMGNMTTGKGLQTVQELLPNVLIPLAIPMMLYSSRFSSRQLGLQMKVVLSGFLSVMLAVALGYVLFGNKLEEGAQIGGIITGMYTGGTLNAAALQAVFKIKGSSFVLINSYDIIISFIYLVFLLTVGIRLFRFLYGQKKDGNNVMTGDGDLSQSLEEGKSYRKLRTREGWKQLLKILGVTVLVAGVSAAIALLFPENWFMVVFILLISTLGVACSFNPQIRAFDMSYDLGMYLIYIFSVTIASMADFSQINLSNGLNLFGYLAVGVFASLTLHAVLCRLMKVDADSMAVSSVAFINSPPFVPMISASMKNREALLTGLAAGVIGYAAGNHLGVLMCWILETYRTLQAG